MSKAWSSIHDQEAQRLVAYELDDVTRVNGQSSSAVFIGFVHSESNSLIDLVPQRLLTSKKGRGFRRVLSEVSESRVSMRSRQDCIKARDQMGWQLARDGYSVNENLSRIHKIYVVELSANPILGDGRPALYVGQTSKSPDDRIREHLSGIRNARFAGSMKVRRPDLEPNSTFDSHSKYNAEVFEETWANELTSRGFRVFGPRGFTSRKPKSRADAPTFAAKHQEDKSAE
jgi:hypothetical protein